MLNESTWDVLAYGKHSVLKAPFQDRPFAIADKGEYVGKHRKGKVSKGN
jgi:hypothetical protein